MGWAQLGGSADLGPAALWHLGSLPASAVSCQARWGGGAWVCPSASGPGPGFNVVGGFQEQQESKVQCRRVMHVSAWSLLLLVHPQARPSARFLFLMILLGRLNPRVRATAPALHVTSEGPGKKRGQSFLTRGSERVRRMPLTWLAWVQGWRKLPQGDGVQ